MRTASGAMSWIAVTLTLARRWRIDSMYPVTPPGPWSGFGEGRGWITASGWTSSASRVATLERGHDLLDQASRCVAGGSRFAVEGKSLDEVAGEVGELLVLLLG